ncbi:MAG: A24 family peptidase [Myxococcota bacterium]|jgi:prepilin peptidase CpaA|nr:A24 family peptidase [Myxococcota bacterium]
MVMTLQLVASLLVCLIASVTDWRTYRIPNWLTFPALGAGLAMGAVGGGQGFVAALVGTLVCGLVPIALHAAGAMGGGDLKLLMSLGALLGVRLGLTAELYAFAAASLWGLGSWIVRGQLASVARRAIALLAGKSLSEAPLIEKTSLRFAPSVLVGVTGALIGRMGVA